MLEDPLCPSHNQSSDLDLGMTDSIPFSPIFDSDLYISIAIRKCTRACTKHPISNFLQLHGLNSKYKAFIGHLACETIPKTIQEALKDFRWRLTILEEMRGLYKNNVWEIGELSKGKKSVGCKLVFIVKYKAYGFIGRGSTLRMKTNFGKEHSFQLTNLLHIFICYPL